MMDGTLETIDGRPALRFERRLAHSVERVWRAVSEPAELERWFPAAADWTPAVGETFEAGGMTGEVTEVDAPRRLAWTFNGERYSFELAAHEDGCLLVFTHVFNDRTLAAQTAAGWETTSRGSSLTSPAAFSPKRRHTRPGRNSTSATRSASGSIPHRAGASSPPSAADLVGVSRDLERLGSRLRDAQRIAERVAQAAVDAVEVLGRLLRELDALLEQLVIVLRQSSTLKIAPLPAPWRPARGSRQRSPRRAPYRASPARAVARDRRRRAR